MKSILKFALVESMKSHKSVRETEEFITVSDIASPELKDVIEIYYEAFPENEREPPDKIKRRIMDSEYDLLVVKRNNTVVGFSLLYVFERLFFGLFHYMAVRKECRNLGIGSRLFCKTYEHFEKATPSGKFLLLEVEDPAYGTPSERSLRLRRQKWYERLGASTIVNFEYFLPPMSADYPTEMLLMVYAGHDQIDVNEDVLRRMLIAVYEEVYGRRADDPYLRRMLKSLGTNSRIQLSRRNK